MNVDWLIKFCDSERDRMKRPMTVKVGDNKYYTLVTNGAILISMPEVHNFTMAEDRGWDTKGLEEIYRLIKGKGKFLFEIDLYNFKTWIGPPNWNQFRIRYGVFKDILINRELLSRAFDHLYCEKIEISYSDKLDPIYFDSGYWRVVLSPMQGSHPLEASIFDEKMFEAKRGMDEKT